VVARINQVTTRARVTIDIPTTHAVSISRLYRRPSIISIRSGGFAYTSFET